MDELGVGCDGELSDTVVIDDDCIIHWEELDKSSTNDEDNTDVEACSCILEVTKEILKFIKKI